MGSLGHSNFGSFSYALDPLNRVCLPQRVPSSLIFSSLQPFCVYVSTYFFFWNKADFASLFYAFFNSGWAGANLAGSEPIIEPSTILARLEFGVIHCSTTLIWVLYRYRYITFWGSILMICLASRINVKGIQVKQAKET